MPHQAYSRPAAGIAFWVGAVALAICVRVAAGACGCTANQEALFYESIRSSNGTVIDNGSISKAAPKFDKYSDAVRIDDMLILKEDLQLPAAIAASSMLYGTCGRRFAQPSQFINCRRLWPNGKLYYRFSSSYPIAYRGFIRQSLARLESETNGSISFIEADYYYYKPHVTIINDKAAQGCWSYVGKVHPYSSQDLCLSVPGCMLESIVQHEFMHALGVDHEQSRQDRDSYVDIQWSNIDSNYCRNFYMSSYLMSSNFPGYDYDSVMHYPSDALACTPGRSTILKANGSGAISQRNNLSASDVSKLKYMYSARNLAYCIGCSSLSASWVSVLACLLALPALMKSISRGL